MGLKGQTLIVLIMKRLSLFFLLILIIGIRGYAVITDTYTLQVGQSISNFWGKGQFWVVSDESVVNCVPVSSNGVYYDITGLKSGHATIKFGWKADIDSYLQCVVDVTVLGVNSISMPSTLSLLYGESYTFTPAIIDAGAATTLTWYSSNTSAATIDNNGLLTTKGIGITTITCTAHNGVSAQCEVTVNPVLVSGIALNTTEAELMVGENLQLKTTIAPENATDKSVTWSSTNETVAVVDGSGLVTAVGSGICQIKALANDGSGKMASCLVIVEKNNKLTVTNMTQCNGGRGFMNVLLTDEETILGFQFDLQLPQGVTVASDGEMLMAALTGNAINTHSISSSKVDEGLYRFVVTSSSGRAISSSTGDGLTIAIDVAEEVAVGTYEITIKDIELTVKKGNGVYEDIHPKDNTAILTVNEALLGDVNGDGRISVTDVISIISYIQEEIPTQFLMKSADVNGDSKISITDAVQVIDMILNKR